MIKRGRPERLQQRDTASLLNSPVEKPQLRRLLSVDEGTAPVMWNRPDSQIIYGRPVEKGYDTAKTQAEETEIKKLHRNVGQGSRPDLTVAQSQAKAAAAPLTKINTTGVKPTFEEFLEFVLDTDLLGKKHTQPENEFLLFYCTPS